MQQEPDQGLLLFPDMSWPLTQLPRIPGGALCLPNKHKESESILHGYQPSFH